MLIIINCRTRIWCLLRDSRNDKCLLMEFSGGEFHRRCSLNVLISDDELARRALINWPKASLEHADEFFDSLAEPESSNYFKNDPCSQILMGFLRGDKKDRSMTDFFLIYLKMKARPSHFPSRIVLDFLTKERNDSFFSSAENWYNFAAGIMRRRWAWIKNINIFNSLISVR